MNGKWESEMPPVWPFILLLWVVASALWWWS